MNWFEQLTAGGLENIEVAAVLRNLLLALVMSNLLAWHYVRYAHVLSNKRKFARVFVFIATTTLLMITVVKTSVALSLGLVGALSIIRFRTPIKEPEELAYLFLAIAVGVGLGADRWLATTVIFVVILLFLAVRGRGADVPQRTVLQITAPLPDAKDTSGAAALRVLLPAVEEPCTKVDLRRVDCHGGELHASLVVELSAVEKIAEVLQRLHAALPGASVSVIDRDGLE
jgi:uncharacterized membrane protein YhiD involved in acid resistance